MNIQKRIVTSANWDSGRGGKKITGIVAHTMVGYIQPSENLFNNPAHGVSVHYGIGLDGSVRQWVEEKDTAWQAGNYSVNQTTIGIEHEDAGNYNDGVRSSALYESSSSLVADICRRHGFPADSNHIFLHKNVIDKSRYPGGTACPDGLDTNKIISMANAKLKGGDMPTLITEGNLDDLCLLATGRPLKDLPATKGLLGDTLESGIRYFLKLPEHLALLDRAAAKPSDAQAKLDAIKKLLN